MSSDKKDQITGDVKEEKDVKSSLKGFELKTRVELSNQSQEMIDAFISDNRERKEIDTHDVYMLLARAAGMMGAMSFANKKPLDEEAQKQLLIFIYDQLCKDEANDFEVMPKIDEIIQMIFDIRQGNFEIDIGKKGWGCIPCFSSVKIGVKK
jgi:hypothetical protein